MKRRSDEELSAPLYEDDAAVRAQYGCFAGACRRADNDVTASCVDCIVL